MKLVFLGGAGEVTGSSFLVETPQVRFLVDCGMFQGGRDAERRNRDSLDFDPRSIDFVLLTHAHIDHSGLIPRLATLGYSGPVFCTRATADLLSVMLPDSGHVQEQEAQWRDRARHLRRVERPTQRAPRSAAPPLYTLLQAQRSLKLLHGVDYDREIAPHPAVTAVFRDAGHILGSALIEAWIRPPSGAARKITFSGDLGLPSSPVVRDPTPVSESDLLVIESTYGDRLHRTLEATRDELASILTTTLGEGRGNVVMPAFAVGRTQSILCVLAQLVRDGRAPPLEIYIDSPMATAATAVTLRHRDLLDAPTRSLLGWIEEAHPEFRLRFVVEPEESRSLNQRSAGAVIISASGMCDAGRIKHHLLHNLPRAGSAVVITGFQAAGTLGRRLVDGARSVPILGKMVPVRASLHTVGGLSAHADQSGLLAWLGHFRTPPQRTWIVHGEQRASEIFAGEVRRRLGWREVSVPARGTAVPL